MTSPLSLHPKVAAPLLGTWVSTIILYALHRWVDANLPVEVGAAIVGVVGFVCGWLAPSPAKAIAPPSIVTTSTAGPGSLGQWTLTPAPPAPKPAAAKAKPKVKEPPTP